MSYGGIRHRASGIGHRAWQDLGGYIEYMRFGAKTNVWPFIKAPDYLCLWAMCKVQAMNLQVEFTLILIDFRIMGGKGV